jgi:methylated-DNA-protein-cysteine methyltransferase-like protein
LCYDSLEFLDTQSKLNYLFLIIFLEEQMSPGFTSPPNPHEFQAQVWDIVRRVPFGKVATYGQVSALVATPPGMSLQDFRSFSPRWVGGAMAACPEGVPWHRIINAQGKISLAPGRGYERQRELLEAEGIEFDSRGRIDLKRYAWDGT